MKSVISDTHGCGIHELLLLHTRVTFYCFFVDVSCFLYCEVDQFFYLCLCLYSFIYFLLELLPLLVP